MPLVRLCIKSRQACQGFGADSYRKHLRTSKYKSYFIIVTDSTVQHIGLRYLRKDCNNVLVDGGIPRKKCYSYCLSFNSKRVLNIKNSVLH